jgi:mannose-1-phosphate guanylyltransferase
MYSVKSFTEKPERDFARIFMESGEFLWNTGIFVAHASHLLSHCKRTMPELFRQIELDGRPTGTLEDEAKLVWNYFSIFPNQSIDYNVLENASDAFVMLCNFGWADLGTWHSIYEAESRYEGDNVVLDSEVMMDNCRDNIIKLPKGHLGVISGLEGYIVVENENVLMVCKKGDTSAQIRKFLNEVQIKMGEEFI